MRTIVWAELRLALVVTGRVLQPALLAVAKRVRETMQQGAP